MAVLKRLGAWPTPALAAWASCWVVFASARRSESSEWVGLGAACALSILLSFAADRPWRRACIAGGFPLSLLASGAASALPGWMWLLPLALLVLVYPIGAWRDAPFFPTPAGALAGLAKLAPLRDGARILDAGCGSGAALRELRRIYPTAHLVGIERSPLLRLLCAWRCRDATIVQCDLWEADWSAYDMVYVFQRPDTMARAAVKANAELQSGGWIVSLEFEALDLPISGHLHSASGRAVWIYRVEGEQA